MILALSCCPPLFFLFLFLGCSALMLAPTCCSSRLNCSSYEPWSFRNSLSGSWYSSTKNKNTCEQVIEAV